MQKNEVCYRHQRFRPFIMRLQELDETAHNRVALTILRPYIHKTLGDNKKYNL